MNFSIELLTRPIPLDPPQVSGWKEIKINGCGEPLVAIGPYSNYPELANDSIYAGERVTSPYYPAGLNGSLLTSFVRVGLAEKLREAQKLLPEGHLFLIWDAYRPIQVQQALFNFITAELAQQKPNLSEAELLEEAQRFVSLPSTNPLRPSPHNTGGVIDLTIIKVPISSWQEIQNSWVDCDDSWNKVRQSYAIKKSQIIYLLGQPLEMGTPFDFVGPETEANYYERLAKVRKLTIEEQDILLNRRLLYNALVNVGIRNYSEEWWHFSYGDQMWGKQVGTDAIYGSTDLTPANLQFESRSYFKTQLRHSIIQAR